MAEYRSATRPSLAGLVKMLKPRHGKSLHTAEIINRCVAEQADFLVSCGVPHAIGPLADDIAVALAPSLCTTFPLSCIVALTASPHSSSSIAVSAAKFLSRFSRKTTLTEPEFGKVKGQWLRRHQRWICINQDKG